MVLRAWLVGRWQQGTRLGDTTNDPAFVAPAYEDIAATPGNHIPPAINLGAWRVDNLPDKAALDALDAAPGVVVVAAINLDTGARVTGYLRPQDVPTGAQLNAARTKLENAGIPTDELTARVTVGMTLAEVADALRSYIRDLRKEATQGGQVLAGGR